MRRQVRSSEDFKQAPVTVTGSGLSTRVCSRNIFSPRILPKNNHSLPEKCEGNGIMLENKLSGQKDETALSVLSTQAAATPNDNKETGSTEPRPSDFTFFAGNSTFHGINHVFREGGFTFRRFLWGIFFITSLSLFLHQAQNRYSFYRSRPHVTKLDEQEAKEMSFPSVTICNINSFRLSQVTTDDYYYVGDILGIFDKKYELKMKNYQDNNTWPFVYSRIHPILKQRGDFKPYNSKFSMFEFYNRTGHDVSAMVLKCKYRGFNCRTMEDWVTVYTRYGKCYTFNSGKVYEPLTTLKGGVDNGLELLLDTQQNEYMPVWDESDEISVEAGFKVQIHVQNEPPFIHELGFGITPGSQTLVATQEQRITFLPHPYGNCIEEFDKEKHYHFETYSISACRITCETKFVVDNCSCKMVHMPGNYSYCDPEQYKKCADKALDYLVKEDDELCVCVTPCEVTRYNLEMSALQLPSTQATSYMAWKYNVTERYVRDNFVKLNIFFEALNYETIEQKVAYEVPGLLGDIGGQMGLFIGASILTILELFDYIYEVIKDKTWGRRLRQAKENSEQRASLTATAENETLSNVISPVTQFHAIPGTIAMPSTVQRPNSFNVMHGPLHQNPSAFGKRYNNGNGLGGASQTYPTMPYRTNTQQQSGYKRNKYVSDEEYAPPPPPQYMGQSMLTLRDHNMAPDSHLIRRPGRGGGMMGNREVSLSYNDLLNLPDSTAGYTSDEIQMNSRPPKMYHTGVTNMSNYGTPTHFSDKEVSMHNTEYNAPSNTRSSMYATTAGGRYGADLGTTSYDQGSLRNQAYIANEDSGNVALLSGQNDTYPRPMSPMFGNYHKTMETDIH